jgi:hypothetical protein
MKYFLLLLVALVASLSSFAVHVVTVEWLPQWVGSQMRGLQIQPSWDVRYIAAFTSMEYGIAAVTIYELCRERLSRLGVMKGIGLYAVLLAALHGAFIRQPLMDYIVGNPVHVVTVQNGFQWLVWILMAIAVVLGAELVHKSCAKKALNLETS